MPHNTRHEYTAANLSMPTSCPLSSVSEPSLLNLLAGSGFLFRMGDHCLQPQNLHLRSPQMGQLPKQVAPSARIRHNSDSPHQPPSCVMLSDVLLCAICPSFGEALLILRPSPPRVSRTTRRTLIVEFAICLKTKHLRMSKHLVLLYTLPCRTFPLKLQ